MTRLVRLTRLLSDRGCGSVHEGQGDSTDLTECVQRGDVLVVPGTWCRGRTVCPQHLVSIWFCTVELTAPVLPVIETLLTRGERQTETGIRDGRVSQVLELRLHGNRRTGCAAVRLQVHRCDGATRDMTESTCMPHPLQVVFPQRLQRAGLHMCCSF